MFQTPTVIKSIASYVGMLLRYLSPCHTLADEKNVACSGIISSIVLSASAMTYKGTNDKIGDENEETAAG